MINILLLNLFLSLPNLEPPCFNCAWDRDSGLNAQTSVTITITLNVVASHLASIDVKQAHPDVENVYLVTLEEYITAEGYLKNTEKFLVFDDLRQLTTGGILVMNFNGGNKIEITAPEMVVFYKAPKTKSPKEMLAFINERNKLEPVLSIARTEK